MPTRFQSYGGFTDGPTQFILRYDALSNDQPVAQLEEKVKRTLSEAQTRVGHTIQCMNTLPPSANMCNLLLKWFGRSSVTPLRPALTDDQYYLILNRLKLVALGLSDNGLVIKTAPLIRNSIKYPQDPDMDGYVTSRSIQNLPATDTKSHHTRVIRLRDGQIRRMGAITVKSSKFGLRGGVRTLIHEACHKFFGAADCYYLNGDATIRKDVLGHTFDHAMINADTYAWFVFDCGKNFNNSLSAGDDAMVEDDSMDMD